MAVCVNVGTESAHLYHPLRVLTYTEQLLPPSDTEESDTHAFPVDRQQLLDWQYQCRIAEVSVVSHLPTAVTLVWVDELNPGNRLVCELLAYT